MHVSDENLKVLIDVLAERLDDDLDMLSDSNFMDEREEVRMAWAVKDLLEKLRQEQRSRGRGGFKATNVDVGAFKTGTPISSEALAERIRTRLRVDAPFTPPLPSELGKVQATMGDHEAALKDHQDQLNDVREMSRGLWDRVRKLEALVSDHEESRMQHHTRLEDHHAKLEGTDPSEVFEAWRQLKGLEVSLRGFMLVVKSRFHEQGEVISRLQEKLQALEMQSDDRWVRTQQKDNLLGVKLEGLENLLEDHVGETGTKH